MKSDECRMYSVESMAGGVDLWKNVNGRFAAWARLGPFGCHAAAAAARWSGIKTGLKGMGGRIWVRALGMLRILEEWG